MTDTARRLDECADHELNDRRRRRTGQTRQSAFS